MKINLDPRPQVCVGGGYGMVYFNVRLQSKDNILISQRYKGTFNKSERFTHVTDTFRKFIFEFPN